MAVAHAEAARKVERIGIAAGQRDIRDGVAWKAQHFSGARQAYLFQVAGRSKSDLLTKKSREPAYFGLATGYLSNPACTAFGADASEPNNAARHNNGANYLLADGHVKFLLSNTVSPG